MNQLAYLCLLTGTVSICCLNATTATQAQIISDGTVSTEVNTSDNRNYAINGGTQAGGNLFHSFRDFSVPDKGSVVFNNAASVKNIISRVTGRSISNIDGSIGAKGIANLFLLNPNGIIFGRNASLKIGGSFLATTASRLNFTDGNFFSATDTQAKPLLTISIPIGLQFGNSVGQIINRSRGENSLDAFQVQPAKTLALVGGDISLEGSRLLAPGGRIELGSVASPDIVSLSPVATGWSLGYEGVRNFQDIRLLQEASINTTGNVSSGDIRLRGRHIAIVSASQVTAFNDAANPGGTLALNSSESVEVSGDSSLTTGAFSIGAAADINIETRRLIVRNGSFVDALTEGDGRGGNITVDASESVELDGSEGLSQLSTQAFAGGSAGDITVKTGRLILRNGGQITSSTAGTGDGGTTIVDASESIEVSGRRESLDGRLFNSGLFARTIGASATGNGGILRINTGRLIVQNGGNISVASVDGSTGQAGTLDINASESVEIGGIGSSLLAASASPKPAGNLTINTSNLVVRDGSEINVSSLGMGNAGNLEVIANSMRVENGGKLTATSKLGSGGGNINLQNANLLTVSNGSEISTTAKGAGNGGNINIDTDNLVLAERSNITAQAVEGRGGNISITTQGLFVSPDSTIDATSDRGINGIVEIRRPDVDPSAELVILPADVVDVSGLVAQGCSAAGGVASGESSFAITGRGGLPPTPAEATRSESILADLGITEKSKVISQKSKAIPTLPETSNKVNLAPLVEATGWVVGSNGEVILTAAVTNDTLNIPWFRPHRCNGT